MIRFEPIFVRGMLIKSVVLAAVFGGLIGLKWGAWVALSLCVGEGLFCADIVAMAWLLRLIMVPGRSSIGLSLLFLLKLLVLFGLTYYFLAHVGLSPAGLTAGFILGLGVLSWQVVSTPSKEVAGSGEPGADGEEE